MNKLEEIHVKPFDVISSFSPYDTNRECQRAKDNSLMAEKSAEITTDVAIKFANYIAENWTPNGKEGCWDSNELNSRRESKYLVDSTEALFEIFINNHHRDKSKELQWWESLSNNQRINFRIDLGNTVFYEPTERDLINLYNKYGK